MKWHIDGIHFDESFNPADRFQCLKMVVRENQRSHYIEDALLEKPGDCMAKSYI